MTQRWRTLGALTEMGVQREALKAWLTARASKEDQRRWMIAKKESGNPTGLVGYPEFHKTTCSICLSVEIIFKIYLYIYFLGIGGFMVRQRKCHTRMKKEFFAQLAGETTLDGQPIERTIDEG